MKKQLLVFCSHLGSFLKYIWSRYNIFFKYGLGIGVLAWMVWQYWDKICKVLLRPEPFNWTPLFLALVVNVVSLVITFLRWHLLVRAQDLPFKVADAVRLGLLGLFWSTFLPGSVTATFPRPIFWPKNKAGEALPWQPSLSTGPLACAHFFGWWLCSGPRSG